MVEERDMCRGLAGDALADGAVASVVVDRLGRRRRLHVVAPTGVLGSHDGERGGVGKYLFERREDNQEEGGDTVRIAALRVQVSRNRSGASSGSDDDCRWTAAILRATFIAMLFDARLDESQLPPSLA